MTKRVVILGAGIGGVAAANELIKLTKGKTEIVLVDQTEQYEFSPSYLWVLSGTLLALVSITTAPWLTRAFRFSPLSPLQWTLAAGVGLGLVLVFEAAKHALMRGGSRRMP